MTKPVSRPPVTPEREESLSNDATMSAPVGVKNTSIAVLAVLSTIFFMSWAKAFLIPLLLAAFVSYALHPIVDALKKLKIPRLLGATLTLFVLVSAIGFSTVALKEDAVSAIAELPKAVAKLTQVVRAQRQDQEPNAIEQVQEAAEDLQKEIEQAADVVSGEEIAATSRDVTKVQIAGPTFNIGELFWGGSLNVIGATGQTAAVLVLCFFILVYARSYKEKLVRISGPTLEKRKVTVRVVDEINVQLRNYLLVLLISMMFVGALSWASFAFFGLNDAAFWGISAGILCIVPYLGPAVIFVATAIVAFMQFETLSMAMLIGGISVFITSVQGFILLPMLSSKATNINAPALFVGLLFWAWLWGPWGLVFATPLLVVIKTVCGHIDDLMPVEELLG